jgi:hypothetical protein
MTHDFSDPLQLAEFIMGLRTDKEMSFAFEFNTRKRDDAFKKMVRDRSQEILDERNNIPNKKPDAEFDGADYNPALDDDRLNKQVGRVYDAIKDGAWLTLDALEKITGDPQASISAQLRHLRKERFGSHNIERRRDESVGTWEYRLNVV